MLRLTFPTASQQGASNSCTAAKQSNRQHLASYAFGAKLYKPSTVQAAFLSGEGSQRQFTRACCLRQTQRHSLPIQAVMDVGGPDSSGKQQQLEGQEVHGHNKEHPAVGQRLQSGCLVSALQLCSPRRAELNAVWAAGAWGCQHIDVHVTIYQSDP